MRLHLDAAVGWAFGIIEGLRPVRVAALDESD